MKEHYLSIEAAATALAQGKLVGIPTETVYGLAANAFDEQAVNAVFVAKNRPHFDPLIVHLKSPEQVEQFCTAIPSIVWTLIEAFWPGPLTLLLPKKPCISDLITAGLPRVAVRMPRHSVAHTLLQQLDFPLVAPSANPFGYISPTTPQHVLDQLGDCIAGVIDGGPCEIGLESTILGIEASHAVIYREGGVSRETLAACLGDCPLQLSSAESKTVIHAPGQLTSHYAPTKPVYFDALARCLRHFNAQSLGTICFREPVPSLPLTYQFVLSPTGDLGTAAQQLFRGLRELDRLPVQAIYAEKFPEVGLGRAINDRLRRASHRL